MTIKLHETTDGFIPSDNKSEDFCQRVVNQPSPYDDSQLGLIGFVEPTVQVTRKDGQDADPI